MIFIDGILGIIETLIFISAILSWVIPDRNNVLVMYINKVVDPILWPFKCLQDKIIPNSYIDFSPAVAIIILQIMRSMI